MPENDEVDRIVDAWSAARPDLDFAPLQVLSRVKRLAGHLEQARRTSFAKAGLESWEFDVLAALRREGGAHELSPKALLQQNRVSSGTMTNRVDRLEQRGLVERRSHPGDGRGIIVALTEAGRERVDAAITELLVAERGLLGALSPQDLEHLTGLLRRLSIAFDIV